MAFAEKLPENADVEIVFRADLLSIPYFPIIHLNSLLCSTQENSLGGLGILLAVELSSVDHVGQSSLGLLPLAGLKSAIWVDPELLWLQELKHLLDAVLDLLLGRNTWGVNVVDTWANVAWVSLVDKDLQELSIRLGVLNGENIGVESGNSVEEVLELGVAEVGVNLGRVLDTSGRQAESLDGPGEVVSALLSGTKWETLTKSWLVDLDDGNTGGLKVNDLVAEGKSQLLSLDGLVNIVTWEGPSEAGNWAGQHSLHWLLGDGDSELGLLDGHWRWAGDITNNDWWTNAAGTVRLNPSVGGEGVSVKTLAKVLNHIVTLWLTVNVDIEVKLLLDPDDIGDLLLNELLVLGSGDLTLGKLVTLDTDVLGLWERANGGGWEHWKLELLLLLGDAGWELGLAVVHLWANLRLTLLDGWDVGALGGSTSLDRLGVGLECLTDGCWALSDGLGDGGDLSGLLDGEGKPVGNLSIDLLLGSKSVWGVEQGGGGGNNDALLTELLDGRLDNLDGLLEVGLPDVTSVNDTDGEDGLWAERLGNGLELLWVADEIDVDSVDISWKSVQVVDDVTKVGGKDELWDGITESGELLVGWLEGGLDLGVEIENEGWLIDLNGLGTGGLKLLEEVDVDWDELLDQGDWVNGLVTVWLSEGKEGDWADQDWAGDDTGLLGFVELSNGLWLSNKLELLVVLEGWLDVVVVRVEPLDHLEGWNIDTILLVATAHGEVLINLVQVVLGVSLWDSLYEILAAV